MIHLKVADYFQSREIFSHAAIFTSYFTIFQRYCDVISIAVNFPSKLKEYLNLHFGSYKVVQVSVHTEVLGVGVYS